MAYKVYVKDDTTKGRFIQWDRKNRSQASATAEMTRAKAKYGGKKMFGNSQWQLRKVNNPARIIRKNDPASMLLRGY